MSWQQILQIDPGSSVPLRERVDLLFEQQRATWPALREGEAALPHLQRKTLESRGASIIVQANPGRRRSTHAKTDAAAVAARPCFLCPANMPAEERGVEFESFVVMPNPYPILSMHCTIASREHTPQRIADNVGTFLRMAAEIGPDLATLYNGPRCGASAPDHLHFQAARADQIPILSQIGRISHDQLLTAHSSFGRNMLLFSGSSDADVQSRLKSSIEVLKSLESDNGEPMINLLAYVRDGRHLVVLFPRAAHRPACYFESGPRQLSVSPAILEMCGVVVVAETDQFDRIDAPAVRSIYEEVSLRSDLFNRLLAAVT